MLMLLLLVLLFKYQYPIVQARTKLLLERVSQHFGQLARNWLTDWLAGWLASCYMSIA